MASSVRYRPTCTCVEIAPLWRTPSDPTRTNINPPPTRSNASWELSHDARAPFDHQPRRYSATHGDGVNEEMGAMRAETYGGDETDPAQDITPLENGSAHV